MRCDILNIKVNGKIVSQTHEIDQAQGRRRIGMLAAQLFVHGGEQGKFAVGGGQEQNITGGLPGIDGLFVTVADEDLCLQEVHGRGMILKLKLFAQDSLLQRVIRIKQ